MGDARTTDRRGFLAVVLGSPLAALACSNDGPTGVGFDLDCIVDSAEFQDGGVGRDQIPALIDPEFVFADDPGADYLRPLDRVLGFVRGDEVLAVPHNILWWHEIVNLELADGPVAITYCPLTGTGMAFDRRDVGGSQLGVSGLLFRNNLVMFDRASETLWPQIMGNGACGQRQRDVLSRLVLQEMTWERWLSLHPGTLVASSATGFSRNYQVFPYGNYEQINTPPFLPTAFDESRQPKERLLGLEGATGTTLALPFRELDDLGDVGVVELELDGEALVVLSDVEARTALAFRRTPHLPSGQTGAPVELIAENGGFVDVGTGSEWTLSGRAISGPLAGAVLPGYEKAMVAFWFAWTAFHADTEVWIA